MNDTPTGSGGLGLAGRFIVLDGPDGSGKGAQLDRVHAWLSERGADVVRTRDPGGTDMGDRIRHLLLNYDLRTIDPRCETLLFMASRAQLVAEVITPALAAGQTVLCDRFISSTCAYQAAAGFPRDAVIELGRTAVQDVWPDLTIILDVPPEIGFQRTGRTAGAARKKAEKGQAELFDGASADAMERRPLAFHRAVRDGFLTLAEVYPRPVAIVDATRSIDAVFNQVSRALTDAFG